MRNHFWKYIALLALIPSSALAQTPAPLTWEQVRQRFEQNNPTLLAGKLGIDADGLAATVERFNGFARRGQDLDFDRGRSDYEAKLGRAVGLMTPIEHAPFIAIRCKPSILGTKSGVRTNEKGQALCADGKVIGGLYCAGNVMANPVGTRTLARSERRWAPI